MIIFLSILLIVLIVACTAANYYAGAVPFLAALSTPLIIACVVVGVVWLLFLTLEIRNGWKGKK